jgi:hypothetical protein
MVNKFSVEVFKQLRVYRRFSLPLILNDMACNRLMKLSFFVDHAPLIYRYACKLIGKNFINELLNSTYCKVFTAGNTIEEADQASEYFRSQGTSPHMQASLSYSTTALREIFTMLSWNLLSMKMLHFLLDRLSRFSTRPVR